MDVHFHISLMEDILMNLPAKALLRFSCVCRPWLALMSESDFQRRRLTKSGKYDEKLLLFSYQDMSFYTVEIKLKPCVSVVTKIKNTILLEHKVTSNVGYNVCRIVGSCLSLVCLHHLLSDTLFLFNPLSFDYKILPPLPKHLCTYYYYDLYGLCYDSSTDDYKLIFLQNSSPCFELKDKPIPPMLYSLKSNSWKIVSSWYPTKFCLTPAGAPGMLLNGATHWLIADFSGDYVYYYILCFKFAEEKFDEFPLHYGIIGLNESCDTILHALGVMDECICLAFPCSDDFNRVGLWKMCEYGVQQSWTKLSVINLQPILQSSPLDRYGRPMCVYQLSLLLIKHEKILLYILPKLGPSQLVWLDFASDTFERIEINVLDKFAATTFIDGPSLSKYMSLLEIVFAGESTLVLIGNGGPRYKKKTEEEKEEDSKTKTEEEE